MLATLWLIVLLIGLALATRRDQRSYAAFKGLTGTVDRTRAFRRWTMQSFVMLVGASLVTAWMLGARLPITALPAAFQPLADGLKDGAAHRDDGQGTLGMMFGVAAGVSLGVGVQVWRMRRALAAMIGDVEALIPRGARERIAAVPLCLNAGFSEELFFRLALPLLIARVTGSVPAGMAAAAVVFGLMHAYQGWKGVLGTTLLGVLLTTVYLNSGSLVRPMVAHAMLDLLALIVRPWVATQLAGWLDRRGGRAVAEPAR